MKSFEQCIATGGTMDKTLVKIEAVGIGKYFSPEQIFTADMVEHGKPKPDLFLLAAQKWATGLRTVSSLKIRWPE